MGAVFAVTASLLATRAIPASVLAGLIAAAALAVSIAAWPRLRDQGSASRAQPDSSDVVRRYVDEWPPPTADEIAKRVLEGSPFLGLPYVARDSDQQIEAALRRAPFVVVVGAAGCGKTSSLLHSARVVYPRHRVIAPTKRPGSVARLIALGPPVSSGPFPDLLLLDDIANFALDPTDVAALSEAMAESDRSRRWFTVLATARDADLQRLVHGAVSPSLDRLLEHAELVHLPRGLSDHESSQLLRHWRPELERVTIIAADWERTGIGRPITRNDLRDLARAAEGPDGMSDADFQSSLESSIASEGLKMCEDDGSGRENYLPSTVIVEERRKRGEPVATAIWNLALSRASPAEALSVARAAHQVDANWVAEAAFLSASRSDDPDITSEAALRLGDLADRAGDTAGAAEWMRLASRAENPDIRDRAAYAYAVAVSGLGRSGDARALLEQIVRDARPSAPGGMAAIALAELHRKEGNAAAADAVLRAAVDRTGDPAASFSLAQALLRQADTDEAIELFQLAARQGHPRAMEQLGALAIAAGDPGSAEEWLRQAASSGLAEAALRLGALLTTSQPAEAELWLRRAMERAEPDSAASAALNLGRLLQARGDSDGARDAFQRAMDYTARMPGESPSATRPPAERESRVLAALGAAVLNETQIASAALLSPSVVSEVLSNLVADGLVEVLPGRRNEVTYSRAPLAAMRAGI